MWTAFARLLVCVKPFDKENMPPLLLFRHSDESSIAQEERLATLT